MSAQQLHGTAASPGAAFGPAWRPAGEPDVGEHEHPTGQEHERELAHRALAEAAEALERIAAGLPPEEAAIVETGVLMAQDPALVTAVDEGIVDAGLPAAEAIIRATERHADTISAIGDETLAARADDVRSLGRRAARLSTRRGADVPPANDVVLIAHDVGPAEVAELAPTLAGVALVGGGATAHAAIVARSLGIPMVTGVDPALLEIADGTELVLDGTLGAVFIEPSAARARAAEEDMRARRLASKLAEAARDEPAVTTDGTRITVLANVASSPELEAGLAAGAEGIGLLRTELAFLDASEWPTEQEHRDALEPILAGLQNRPAVVRVLDFGADKAPPFLHGTGERGLELLLANPDAFRHQLRAILTCARGRDVRILLPMVDEPEQITASRALASEAATALGIRELPPLGAMIETPLAVQNAAAIAARSDFLSIGTNDLTAATLGVDRFSDTACAHHPLVLQSIAHSVAAAHDAGIALEVCGEAASEPVMLQVLVGLGVDELSVGAARVGEVRRWIRQLSAERAKTLAQSVLSLRDAEDVERTISAAGSQAHALSA